MSNPQALLQSLTDEYQSLQTDLTNAVQTRQRLEAQQQENLGVQKEFKTLKDDANVFKLVGPVLLKQDKDEAVAAVNGRLEFIGGEIKRVETQLQSLQDKSEAKKMEIYQLQNEMQGQGQGQGQQRQVAA